MTDGSSSDLRIRRADENDLPVILELASAALGWRAEDPNEALFRWKHLENPFGPSPMWLAERDRRLAGFRAFMNWEFQRADGTVARAVRAVDTATHPDFQGQGVFTRLTLHAIEELEAEGIDFVFNTPNDQSRPGYLKMGWQIVGRVRVEIRPRGVGALMRIARSRVPAEKWSVPTDTGLAPDQVATDGADTRPTGGLATRRTPAYLAWRHDLAPMHFRAVQERPSDPAVFFRLRRRGAGLEGTITGVDDGNRPVPGTLWRDLLDATKADYLIRAARHGQPRGGFVPLPRQGPVLTYRGLRSGDAIPLNEWDLQLGDVTLF